ncbi:MAG TPA: 2'-5' RNA ligase family protein [Burkholderiaceae bacterium]|nr:2'-5' RNA ligase family protein [Burkholderiaceae bacterium]
MRPNYFAEAYGRVWAAFQSSRLTVDGRHDTPHWLHHRGRYAACIIRVRAQDLQPGLHDMIGALEHLPALRIHPDYFLHIMLQELGFVVDNPEHPDEISAARLEEFAHSAIEPVSSVAPLQIGLGGANAFQDAVFLEIDGGESVARLHARLFDLAAIPRAPEYLYLPHCTVAHFAGESPAGEAARAIAPWRTAGFGQFVAAEVEVVTLATSEAYPELESYAVIPFGK